MAHDRVYTQFIYELYTGAPVCMCTCRMPDCELTSNLPVLRQWPRLLCQLLEESRRVVRLWTDPYNISVEKMIHANSTLSMKQVPTPCFDSANFGRCLRVANCSDFDGAELVGCRS